MVTYLILIAVLILVVLYQHAQLENIRSWKRDVIDELLILSKIAMEEDSDA